MLKLVYKHINCRKSPLYACNFIIFLHKIQDPYNNFAKINGHKNIPSNFNILVKVVKQLRRALNMTV